MVYEIDEKEQFLKDLEKHRKSGQKSILAKIENLVDELRQHPKTGTGKPEQLSGSLTGQWSRHITHKHRLVYEIYENVVTVLLISAYGHYGDK